MPLPRIVASIEARMGSSRLPGKVLADIAGKPALTRLLQRLRCCSTLDGIVVATSNADSDDAIESWAQLENVACFRGSEEDVLGRVVGAHEMMASDIIVEITGDCVLTDPDIIDWGVDMFLSNQCDVVANCEKPGFPLGMYVQVFRRQDLEHVASTIDDAAVREHVSLYFYEHPELYRILHLTPPRKWADPDRRLCLDYPADLQLMRRLFHALEPVHGELFGLEQILALLATNEELASVNSKCIEKPVR